MFPMKGTFRVGDFFFRVRRSSQILRTDVVPVEIGSCADDVSQLSREPWLNPIDRRRP